MATHSSRPTTRAALAAAILALPEMDPVDRITECIQLIDDAKHVLSREGNTATLEAADSLGQTGLARRLNRSRATVTAKVAAARAEQAEQQAATE